MKTRIAFEQSRHQFEDYKQVTRDAYDRNVTLFDTKFDKTFQSFTKPFADHFLATLPGKSILDLGSGPGHEAAYFQQNGRHVLCIDISHQMIERCRAKGLAARLMDIEDIIALPHESYDGIWAYTSLLHLPKARFPSILKTITALLASDGILGVGLKEGTTEGYEPLKNDPTAQRWFSYYTDDELRTHFSQDYTILNSSHTVFPKSTFLNYLLQHKERRQHKP